MTRRDYIAAAFAIEQFHRKVTERLLRSERRNTPVHKANEPSEKRKFPCIDKEEPAYGPRGGIERATRQKREAGPGDQKNLTRESAIACHVFLR